MRRMSSLSRQKSDTIGARRDRLRLLLWGAALVLAVAALAIDPRRVWPSARGTAGPFLTLGLVIVAGAVVDRLGAFRLLARVLIPTGASPVLAFAAVLGFTAILSGFVNLDVAVVLAMPIALRVAERTRLPGGWLAIATAITANAASFLLPTSNLTNLLVLSRSPLPAWTYLRASWVAWLAVTVLTVAGLSLALSRRPNDGTHAAAHGGMSLRAVADLAPMFFGATAIRALLGSGLILHGGLAEQVTFGSLLAAGANNLPAAVAVHAFGTSGRWAALLAMAIGPNLLVSGSVATLICRRIADEGGAHLGAGRFSLLGLAVVPVQILAAVAGLHATGALP